MRLPIIFPLLLLFLPFFSPSSSSSSHSSPPPPVHLNYHGGLILTGNITFHLLFYGHFSPSYRDTITDFLLSLPPSLPTSRPSVASWWSTTRHYGASNSSFFLSPQTFQHSSYPLGRSLKSSALHALAAATLPFPGSPTDLVVLLTDADVTVEDFCSKRCGTHARLPDHSSFIWVGDSSTQCPGECAWPFALRPHGRQKPPPYGLLTPPNGDVGADGAVINLATLLAGTVTNYDGRGYFLGSEERPREAVSACAGKFGRGTVPGDPGRVMVDAVSGASYNAEGVNGRKFLLPAMWNPESMRCETLI